MNYQTESDETWNRSSDNVLKMLSHCGITACKRSQGLWLTSSWNLFKPFGLQSGIHSWRRTNAPLAVKNGRVSFHDSLVQIRFDSNAFLMVYKSGHIRWIPQDGLNYYAELFSGHLPGSWQGDLMGLYLDKYDYLPDYERLNRLASQGPGKFWAEPRGEQTDWQKTKCLPIGRNGKHTIHGAACFRFPVANDSRTILIKSLEEISIDHTPDDDIHPQILIPPEKKILITKLPGFSNPSAQMFGNPLFID